MLGEVHLRLKSETRINVKISISNENIKKEKRKYPSIKYNLKKKRKTEQDMVQ